MRVTNNMMINNTTKNINGNKANQTYLNNQMTTQKKILRPSENPIIAIRALRLRSTLSQLNQYYEKNIPDVEAWYKMADTAFYNMNKILTDCQTKCNYGNNTTITADDRKTILESLTALRTQLYSEGNTDNAGRSVFTGYRTNSTLTFMEDDPEESYDITQSFTYEDISEFKYYSGNVEVPQTLQEVLDGIANGSDRTKSPYISDTTETAYDRIRLAYDGINDIASLNYKYGTTDVTFTGGTEEKVAYYDGKLRQVNANGNPLDDTGAVINDKAGNPVVLDNSAIVTRTVYQGVDAGGVPVAGATLAVYDTEVNWEAAMGTKIVGDGEMVFIKNTGDLVLGSDVSNALKSGRADIQIDYDKTGFTKGELRPEYYYNCTCKTDPDHPVENIRYDENGKKVYEDINFNIGVNQSITVNFQADDFFDMSIYQDVTELMNATDKAIKAHDKVAKLEEMQREAKYVDHQDEIQKWLDAARKEADYADENLGNQLSAGVGKFSKYLKKLNVMYTEIGSRGQQLEMTKNRLENQQLAVEELKSTNEDRELSDIIIDYTAAYNAYQASLMAASKIEKQTLLNYI
ncbi:flagellin N-terminal helical domain-containing protein [Roseburia sp. 1XD42-69]|uniref:flagellin N-terminal helical domain-containing protein n=1 Tax=Roseburia sp. 1XD42-69 TaxID=2320088 RepID=UPI000EA300BD|nr:flagellar hook-associated protein 3 [Roseburia sp. 1XD42-69]MCX4320111.1 flagellar hook-associated protein 3 [Lachnospiraceae bacterium]RKJ63155.1 flagellar hook-associated protein 3 [Roseburia sp. 1XD42-69]